MRPAFSALGKSKHLAKLENLDNPTEPSSAGHSEATCPLMTPYGLGVMQKEWRVQRRQSPRAFRHHLASPHQSGGRSDEGETEKGKGTERQKTPGESHCRVARACPVPAAQGLSSPLGPPPDSR